MTDIVRSQLQQMITQFGRSVCDEPKRCEALLKDLCPNHKCEVRLLVVALGEGVVKKLVQPSPLISIEQLIAQLVQSLDENWGIASHHAQWAVESWAIVLGVKFNSAVVAPVPEQSKVVMGGQTAAKVTTPIDHAAAFEQIKQQNALVKQQKLQIEVQKRWQKIGQHGELVDFAAPQWAAAIDKETQLMWAINPSQTANFPNPKNEMTWDDAMAWADYVNTQGWCGFNDWRLPTIDELKTLLTKEKQPSLYIREDIFDDIFDKYYRILWSSSPVASNSNHAWIVSFCNRKDFSGYKSVKLSVRLVRAS